MQTQGLQNHPARLWVITVWSRGKFWSKRKQLGQHIPVGILHLHLGTPPPGHQPALFWCARALIIIMNVCSTPLSTCFRTWVLCMLCKCNSWPAVIFWQSLALMILMNMCSTPLSTCFRTWVLCIFCKSYSWPANFWQSSALIIILNVCSTSSLTCFWIWVLCMLCKCYSWPATNFGRACPSLKLCLYILL
jgi:hypothetical protein